MILFYGLDSWHANLFRNFARRRLQKLAQGRRSWLWGWPGHLLPELKVHRDLALPSHSARSGWYWAGPLFQYHNDYWNFLLMSISPVVFPKSEIAMLFCLLLSQQWHIMSCLCSFPQDELNSKSRELFNDCQKAVKDFLGGHKTCFQTIEQPIYASIKILSMDYHFNFQEGQPSRSLECQCTSIDTFRFHIDHLWNIMLLSYPCHCHFSFISSRCSSRHSYISCPCNFQISPLLHHHHCRAQSGLVSISWIAATLPLFPPP